VLILRGGKSEAFLDSTGRLLAHKLPHAEYHEIEGASHFLPMEKPGAVVEAVRSWAQKNTLSI
jgi:pimeloyl-ACP methyl ester carboxylesterase